MKRRNLLACIGAGSFIGIGGCLGEADSTTPNSDDQPCPPYETERASAVCSHTVDPDTAAVYIESNPERSTLSDGTPVEDNTLTLHNQSSTELTFNPHGWSIWHNSGTEWKELQQELSGDGHLTVSPDNAHSWSFTEAVESIQEEPAFEPGLYAAELGVPDPENSDDWIACIALVQLNTAE